MVNNKMGGLHVLRVLVGSLSFIHVRAFVDGLFHAWIFMLGRLVSCMASAGLRWCLMQVPAR